MENRYSAVVQAVASTLRAAQTNCTLAIFSEVNGCRGHIDLSLIGWPIDGAVDFILECLSDRMFELD
jgi:hypothetical protein